MEETQQDIPELPPLNISVVANKLLDCEKNPRDSVTFGYDPEGRAVVLDLHHLLEEEFRLRSPKPDGDYLTILRLFCEYEDNPDDSTEWRIDRNAVAGCLLAHLRQHRHVVDAEEWPPPQSDDDLKQFVDDFVEDRLFTDKHLKDTNELMSVFTPIGLGAYTDRARHELSNIGIMYERLIDSGPRSTNGLPCFFSVKFLNRVDWERCVKAIGKHHEAPSEIEV